MGKAKKSRITVGDIGHKVNTFVGQGDHIKGAQRITDFVTNARKHWLGFGARKNNYLPSKKVVRKSNKRITGMPSHFKYKKGTRVLSC